MSSMPAPWRCVWSSSPLAALVDSTVGVAAFWMRLSMFTPGRAPNFSNRVAPVAALGIASRISAAPPATCGADMDVPDRVAVAPRSSGYVDRMPPPGAPSCGFRLRSAARPKELKPEIRPPVPKG